MRKVQIVKAIVKAYFFGAIAGSFIHLITAADKAGLSGVEKWSVPLLIDGIAIIGLIMRSDDFSMKTRKMGFRVQLGAGALSLAGNVYAAHNFGGAMYGVAIVSLFVLAEWLSDNIESVDVDKAAALSAKRKASAAKAAATRRRNARQSKAIVKGAETMLKSV